MAKKRFKWFLLVRLAGIVLFLAVLAQTDLHELWHWISVVDIQLLLLAILFQLLGLLIKAWRWYILNEEGFSAARLIRRSGEFFEAYAVGVTTPGRVGELMKAGHAGTRHGILGAGLRVIAERGTDLSIFIIIAGIAIARNVLPGVGPAWGWLVLLGGLAGALISFLILISPSVVNMAERLMRWLKLLKKDQPLGYYHRPKRNAMAFLVLSVAGNLSYFICCYFLANGVDIDLSLIGVSGGVATAGVVNTIPVTIMGLGTREITFLYVFQEFPRAQVMAFSGLVFLVAQVGGGLLSLLLGQVFLLKGKNV
jgi:uncharacterized membrane protein YbhN (UPF0104 family)